MNLIQVKRAILLFASLLVTSSLNAVPLTWNFNGTTTSGSTYNGNSIEGLPFELRIFLDTSVVGHKIGGLADVVFFGPFQGEAQIDTLGVLLVDPFQNVQNFAPGGLVTGVQFVQFAFSGIQFASSISNDSLHLTPIPPTAPTSFVDGFQFSGPNNLFVFGEVATFSATLATTVPDAGSTALLLTLGLLGLVMYRRQLLRRQS